MSGGSQTSTRIEQLAPELDKIISVSEPILHLADGFGGVQGPAEGPVWWREGDYLLFSDIHNNKRMKYVPGTGVSLFQEPTNRANGLTRDLQGRLLACEHDSRRVTRQELDGSITVIANSFQGRQLNRPNDVIVKSERADVRHDVVRAVRFVTHEVMTLENLEQHVAQTFVLRRQFQIVLIRQTERVNQDVRIANRLGEFCLPRRRA